MKRIQCRGIVAAMLLMMLFFNNLYAQNKESDKQQAVRKMIIEKNFVFKAQTVQPTAPTVSRQLTSDYDVKVSADTIITFLPYFGRTFTAPLDPTKGGIQFTSTKFEYATSERKKGGWEITIKPQDTQDARLLLMTVSENGYASLQVLSNNRQPISFNGYIDEKKSKR